VLNLDGIPFIKTRKAISLFCGAIEYMRKTGAMKKLNEILKGR
jgi:hypothetical protein